MPEESDSPLDGRAAPTHVDRVRDVAEGIIDQEPPAGTQVARGAPFNLYSARISDCR